MNNFHWVEKYIFLDWVGHIKLPKEAISALLTNIDGINLEPFKRHNLRNLQSYVCVNDHEIYIDCH